MKTPTSYYLHHCGTGIRHPPHCVLLSASSFGGLFLPLSVRGLAAGGVSVAAAFLILALCVVIFDFSLAVNFPHSSALYLGYGESGSLLFSFSLSITAWCGLSMLVAVARTLVLCVVVTTSFLIISQ